MSRMFDVITETWNPITGCQHNCVYCVTGDTLVLTADFIWKRISELRVGEEIVGFTEDHYHGYRYLVKATVLNVIRRRKIRKVYLIKGKRSEVKATIDHRWLVKRSGGGDEGEHNVWRTTSQVIKYGHPIKFLVEPINLDKYKETENYMKGYIAGIFSGDGCVRYYENKRSYFVRLAMKDMEALERVLRYSEMLKLGFKNKISIHRYVNSFAYKIESWSKDVYDNIVSIIEDVTNADDELKRGYLAGIFDAEGSISKDLILRISNYDEDIKKRIVDYGRSLGFEFVIEDHGVRLVGGMKDIIRFLAKTNPCIRRKKENLFGHSLKYATDEFVEIEYIGKEKVYDIVTSSGTFIANGFLSHNCWAKRLVENRLRNTKKYRYGFVPMIHDNEFRKRFNGGTVFVCDMGDLFGDFIPSEWILRVINHVRRFQNTTFLFLTKNPARYFEFINVMPSNVVLGATIETNRDDLYIKHNISRAPLPSSRYRAMKDIRWGRKFVSIEPIIDFDIDILVKWIEEIRPCMVYVGYDNYNNRLPEPQLYKTMELIERLSRFTEVRRKTIRKAWYEE